MHYTGSHTRVYRGGSVHIDGTKPSEILLGPGEFITRIEGTYASTFSELKFVTNTGIVPTKTCGEWYTSLTTDPRNHFRPVWAEVGVWYQTSICVECSRQRPCRVGPPHGIALLQRVLAVSPTVPNNCDRS